MRRKAVFATVFALIALAVAAVVVLAQDTRMEQRDALSVYCLAPRQHEPLSDAGRALGFQVPADLSGWRDDDPDSFWRACEALSAARQAPGPGVFGTLLPFLTAVFGAVLAFGATTWRDRVKMATELAAELRDKVNEYHRAAHAHLADWQVNQPDTEVVAARSALEGPLARVRAAHPDWPSVTEVTGKLAATGLDAGRVDEVRDGVHRIARAVERPVHTATGAAP